MKEKKRGTVIFFPGWPAALGLLGKFLAYLENRYEKVVFFDETFSEKNLNGMTNPIIGISYSAGVIDMIEFVSRFPKKFSFVVMIAPIGTREIVPSLANHYFLFVWEIMKLIWHRKWYVAWKVIMGIGFNFLFHPITSFREVEKIRQYRLYEEVISRIYLRVDFAFIFPAKDDFLPINPVHFIQGRFITESRSCGHFGFLEMPGYYWRIFRDL